MCPMLQSSEASFAVFFKSWWSASQGKKKLFLLLRTSFKKLFVHKSELEAMYTYAH